MNKANYRSDIDGLRAIAVMMVVVFHAFPTALTGGFVGVDVFFVISGFLITGALRGGLSLPYHGIARFYQHRARRLFPALIAVCLSVIVVGWFVLLPDEYAQLGRHLTAGGLFFENFQLLRETGYFDVDAGVKPLMHFWSLSVEEQFYLLFPLAIIAAERLRLRLPSVVLGLLMASLGVSAWYAWQPSSGGYFMPHARFWEILAGSLLQCIVQPPASPVRPAAVAGVAHRNMASLAGVAMIVASGFSIDAHASFPFPLAIPAVAGSALVIWAGPQAWLNRWLLGSKPFVAVGLISYPLYLWHWPVLSFLNIVTSGRSSDIARGVAVFVALALAWATYAWIEKPLRYRWKSPKAASILAAGMAVIVLLGIYIDQRKGMSFRRTARVNSQNGEVSRGALRLLETSPDLRLGCGMADKQVERKLARCVHDIRETPTVALIGDSKSEALAGGLLTSSVPGYRMLYMGGTSIHGAVVPVLSSAPLYAGYQTLARATLESLAQNPSVRVVVLTVATRALFQLKREDSIEDLTSSPNAGVALGGMSQSVDFLVNSGKKVIITVDNPTLPDPKKCIGRLTGVKWLDEAFGLGAGTGCQIDVARQTELRQPYMQVLSKVAAHHPDKVAIFDTLSLLCDSVAGQCRSFKDGKLLYSYTDHTSDHGSLMISASLVPFIQSFDQRP